MVLAHLLRERLCLTEGQRVWLGCRALSLLGQP